jgi:hypothetical protein
MANKHYTISVYFCRDKLFLVHEVIERSVYLVQILYVHQE